MRALLLLLLAIALASGNIRAQADADAAATHAKIEPLHQQWLAEHDPAKRADLASQLIETMIHDYGAEDTPLADEIARDGLPENVLAPPPAQKVALTSLKILDGARWNKFGENLPVMRRMARDRIEAWIPAEGWLFDRKGRLLADAHVPRRDGTGREWYGAFLPDGRWITTDLWAQDRQLTCFDTQGDPRWELPTKKIIAAINAVNPPKYPTDMPADTVGWARADRSGKAWLVGLGSDWQRGLAIVTPARGVTGLPDATDPWRRVYPRSMGVRGSYIEAAIESNDGALTLVREATGHGPGVGWEGFRLGSGRLDFLNGLPRVIWGATICSGSLVFGFWPDSHAIYIESDRGQPDARTVWFFDAHGRYQGEIQGQYLADGANGRSLLVLRGDGGVAQVRNADGKVTSTAARQFTWPDGTTAKPVAIYDDLKLGFFLRGADDNTAVIVLAKW